MAGPQDDTRAAPLGPEPATPAWDQTTVRLGPGQMALVQSLGDPAQRLACLVLYSGAEPGQRHPLREGTLHLGRAPDCELPLESPGISRRHAELQVTADSVHLRDLGSVNGTHVNETRVSGRVRLRDGDLLRLGDVLLKFYPRHSLDALLHDHIYRMATVDAVTGIYTRRYVLDALAREIRHARRSGRPLAVLSLDLDHFKQVNDQHGHEVGDRMLKAFGDAAEDSVRPTDQLFRMGGEEFCFVLPATTLDEAIAVAERIRRAFEAVEIETAGGRAATTVSIGIAATNFAVDVETLLAAADAAVYEAKARGRNRVVVAEPSALLRGEGQVTPLRRRA